MIVGMVDDRALRFRGQSAPPPRPRPVPVLPPAAQRPTAPALTPGDRLFGATFNPNTGFQAGTKPMSEAARQAQAGLNFFNPLATVTDRVLSGGTPRFSDYATDAGLLAAGLIPFVGPGLRAGGQAAKTGAGLTVTGTGDAGRLSALIRKLNKSDDISDFMTERGLKYKERPNEPNEGLFRPGARGDMDFNNVPEPASPYTFGLVSTERLLPLREFDRMAEPAGQKVFGPDNVQKLSEHLAQGGRLDDPLAVAFDPAKNWGYLAEGNHRLAAATALGLERLPATVWRGPDSYRGLLRREMINDNLLNVPPAQRPRGTPDDIDINRRFSRGPEPQIGRPLNIDTNQLRRDPFGDFMDSVGPYYVPPTMHPLLFKYFQQ
jgi:hypothetical protein